MTSRHHANASKPQDECMSQTKQLNEALSRLRTEIATDDNFDMKFEAMLFMFCFIMLGMQNFNMYGMV